MKKCFLFFSLFYINNCLAQLNETFNDGNFTQSPTWYGNQEAFYINAAKQLQTKETADGGSVYLTTDSKLVLNTVWEFDMELKFSPSSYNFVRIYLTSDQQDLNQPLNGYFIEVGAAGTDDSFDLYKQVGSSAMLLIEGIRGRANGNTLSTKLRIENNNGTWTLFSKNKGESSFTEEGSYKSTTSENTSFTHFGIQCNYTRTRSNAFIFDNFKIYPLGETPTEQEPSYSSNINIGDLLINEILFNPLSKGVDFVEIYNNTEQTINLQEVSLATLRADTLTQIKIITNENRPLEPQSFAVLTTNPSNIQELYHTKNPDAFIKMNQLPAFNNDKGSVILICEKRRIDEFHYTEKMHHPLLREKKGVSLERVDYHTPTNQPGNFQSAAASVGYATPGYKNSQNKQNAEDSSSTISIDSKVFTPNNDGVNDYLTIHYKNIKEGSTLNITVFNTLGHIVRRLIRNKLVGTAGSFYWEGTDENNLLAQTGIYILYIETINPDGNVKRYRKTCVLAIPQ